MIQIKVDWRDVQMFVKELEAVEKTFDKPGHGVSYYRPRQQLPSDGKKKPARPWLILGAIRKRIGVDPLDPPVQLERELQAMLEEVVFDAMKRAQETKHPQRTMITSALLGGAKELREDAQERIKDGKTVFHNAPKYARKKAMAIAMPAAHRPAGFQDATSAFGAGRPLVLTGRLYNSMTERWYETEPRTPR